MKALEFEIQDNCIVLKQCSYIIQIALFCSLGFLNTQHGVDVSSTATKLGAYVPLTKENIIQLIRSLVVSMDAMGMDMDVEEYKLLSYLVHRFNNILNKLN